ncbi:MAG: DUF4230 domain-containing protein [Candidatus Shapirobacteria bacterium]|nr:DUF4230 domain-containing protein [Candidatus Shapirobacteria bacterium]
MKKIIIVGVVLVAIIITVTICFKSCQQNDSGLLDLLPKSEKVDTVVNTPLIIEEIQELGRLETFSINLQQTFQTERNQDLLWGVFGEKVTFIAYGQIVAGIDLSKITSEDISIDGKNIKINLPSTEIFYVMVDENQSFIASRQVGFLTSADPQLESQIRRKAQEYFKGQAQNLDILGLAQINAKLCLKKFFRDLGFEEIEFISDIEINLS